MQKRILHSWALFCHVVSRYQKVVDSNREKPPQTLSKRTHTKVEVPKSSTATWKSLTTFTSLGARVLEKLGGGGANLLLA